ncbi:chromate transporter [Aquibacillus albus]|uniref:Chromate transporter n=1 Tax=Aquibacillus albus TaxID=1168171 RepID=A0ABS2N165_9BACI|nr:chromate transporter [Aquibacillus albus]MBM7571879.1 chromate transporter [Aquibacillus albus]
MISQEKQVVATGSYVTDLFAIFLTFIKISPLTFGGGIAMIPHIESEVVNKRNWLTKEEIPNVVAVAQSAPGSIAINSAIYIGYSVRGVLGALSAILGMVLPASLIIIGLTYLYLHYQHLSIVEDAFKGIRPAIIGLIVFASYKIGRRAIQNKFTLLIFLITLSTLVILSLSPFFLIIGGGLAGLLPSIWNRRR